MVLGMKQSSKKSILPKLNEQFYLAPDMHFNSISEVQSCQASFAVPDMRTQSRNDVIVAVPGQTSGLPSQQSTL